MLDSGSHQPPGATYTEINYNEIRCKTGSSVILATSEELDGHTWLVASTAELRSPHHTDVPDQRPEEGSSLQSCLCIPVSFLFLQVSTKKPSQEDSTLCQQTWINPTEFSCQMDVKTQSGTSTPLAPSEALGAATVYPIPLQSLQSFPDGPSPSSLFMTAPCLMVGEMRHGQSTEPTPSPRPPAPGCPGTAGPSLH